MSGTDWLLAHKPAASARVHLFAAAAMWSIVGGLLAGFGTAWALGAHSGKAVVALAFAVLIGALKAHFILGRTANRAIQRIRTRGDGLCLGGFFSWKTWSFVLLMVVAGRVLRMFAPAPIVGVIYVAVGTALLMAYLRFWVAWLRPAK